MQDPIKLTKVRLSFADLFEAKAFQGGAAKYGATFLFDKDSENAKRIKAAMEAVAAEKWGGKAKAILSSLWASNKICYGDGASKAEYDGFEGKFFIRASSSSRPIVIDGNKQPLVEKDGKPYSGCYVHASIDIWAQDNQFGKRVNAGLRGVQFVKDGDAFAGGAVGSVDEFEEIDDQDLSV